MDFQFGGIHPNLKKKEIAFDIRNPLLYEKHGDSDSFYIIFLESFPPKRLLNSAITWLSKTLPAFALYSISNQVFESEDVKQVTDFYSRNHIDYSTVIASYTSTYKSVVVISSGRSIYSLTKSDDINVDDFYDFIFNKTYFYSPLTKTYVVPINALNQIFKDFGDSYIPMDSARRNFADLQLKLSLTLSKEPLPRIDIPTITELTTYEEITRVFEKYKDFTGLISYDYETTGLHFIKNETVCLTFSLDEKEGYYIDFRYGLERDIVITQFITFISNKKIIGQNVKFDHKFTKKYGNPPMPFDDTLLLAQYLCEFRKNGLKSLAWYYTPFGGYDTDLEKFKKRFQINNYGNIPPNVLRYYATMDAILTLRIYNIMRKQLLSLSKAFPPNEDEFPIEYFYEMVLLPEYRHFIGIEYEGTYIDMQAFNELALYVKDKIQKLKEALIAIFGITTPSFNLDSPKQLARIIEYDLGWKDHGRAKEGYYLTGDEQISLWAKEGNRGAKELQEYRSLNTIYNTYLGDEGSNDGWRKHIIKHEDGTYRVHSDFGIGFAESKRNTCRDPNLQNMPAHGEIAERFKKVLTVPPPDEDGKYLFGTLDYASLQIRLCALNSNDPTLCDIYRTQEDPDLHSTTAYSLVKQASFNFVEIEDGDIKLLIPENKEVEIVRGGDTIVVLAKDLQETDVFISLSKK